jgi:conjugative relaxase-like TrwC/TraI family protein
MISFSKGAMNVGRARIYFENHYSIGDYYTSDEDFTNGYLLGKGAEALQLSGHEITAEQFNRLLNGHHPVSDVRLRPKAPPRIGKDGKPEEPRAGWDMTLSPPKSVSIAALVCGDGRLIEADRRAAIYAIEEAQKMAQSRTRGGREWVQTDNIVAVMFEHHEARESQNSNHGPMPQLHHHAFIANLTQRPDGQWRGLDPHQIYKSRSYIDAVYTAELAREVQRIGYKIERRTDGRFELAGYSRAQIEAFSERHQNIKEAESRLGLTGAPSQALRNRIVMETRKAKGEYDPKELEQAHRTLATEQGIDLTYRPVQPVRSFPIQPEAQAERSLNFALAHTTDRTAVPDDRDIVTTALKHGVGIIDLSQLRAQMESHQARGEMIAAGASHIHPLGKYTTPEMIKLEQDNVTMVRDARGRPVTGMTITSAVSGKLSGTGGHQVKAWAAVRQLFTDQTEAAVLTLSTPSWASGIEGLAGTTKTTLVGAIREFAQQQGWTVRGFGTTSGSVSALSGAGIEAATIAKLLATTLPAKRGPELWMVDESSLLATRPVNQLLKLARQRQVERVVFVGDQKQHLAVEAGAPVRQFLADNMAVAELTTIRRQQDPGLKRAVELAASEHVAEAIDLLESQKRIAEIPDTIERHERIAAEYLEAHEARQQTLVVSPANEERKAINQAIRAKLIEQHYVASIGQEHRILIPRDLTPAQLQHARSYHEGNVLYFSRGSKQQGIPKRAYLTVVAIDENTLTLQAEKGRRIEFTPARFKGVQAYEAETRTIAVGDRLQWREPDNRRHVANGEYATVTKLEAGKIEVRMAKNGHTIAMPLADARKVDLGYASTSHASQGSTVDRVIINIDSSRSAELVNQRQFYVSLSRARLEAHIYTDDKEQMRRAAARTLNKSVALEAIGSISMRQ